MLIRLSYLSTQHLLRGALNTLSVRVAIVVILLHGHAVGTEAERPRALRIIDILEVGGLGHLLARGHVGQGRRREDLSQSLERGRVLRPVLVGELDVELDVHVAEVVVAVGWHTLSTDHLHGVWESQVSNV